MTRRTLLFFPFLALPMLSQGKSKGKDKRKNSDDSGIDVTVDIFIGRDRRIIRDWVRDQPASSLPRGLARRESLPPGLRKQLAKKGKLPPGLEKRLSPFPDDLNRRLSPLQDGLERVFVHGRAAILIRNTQVILDVFLP
jgi:hypothetical protein